MGKPRGGDSVALHCTACGWKTFRVYRAEGDGFGRCNDCGAGMQRAPRIREEQRFAKAKRELAGGPAQ